MCIICLDWNKKKLTLKEAYNNLGEMKSQLDEDHFNEVYEMLNDAFYDDILSNDENNGDWEAVTEAYDAFIAASSSCDWGTGDAFLFDSKEITDWLDSNFSDEDENDATNWVLGTD